MSHRKNILVTGANGLIGRELCHELTRRAYTVRTLSRTHGDFKWDIHNGYIDAQALNGVDCAVHLAGETIAQRWTADSKKRIRESRVKSTQLLASEILRQSHPVKLICASGINYYGYDNPEAVTERSAPGSGFLADLCQEWERAAKECAHAGLLECASAELNSSPLVRRSHGEDGCPMPYALCPKFIRTGVVLSPKGGALKKMLPPFKAGLGGRIGSGRQMMSWISLEDIVRVYIRAIEDNTLSGAVNAVAPNPVTNSEFTDALSAALKRPAVFPVPSFMVKLLFGEMGQETILSNLNVVPEKLQQCGFEWQHAEIDSALNAVLN